MKLYQIAIGLAAVACVGLSLATPSQGCIALPREAGYQLSPEPIHLDEQRAFLWSEKGSQHMLLSVKYSGSTEEFAWVIPVESRPKMEVDKGAPFTELRRLTEVAMPSKSMVGVNSAPAGAAPQATVKVLERREEGPYDLAVLEASSGDGLYIWLKSNHFHLSKDAKGVLEHYVQRKFVFVAARIRNQAQKNQAIAQRLRDGNIAPMHLSFKAKELSYPLKVTSGNPGMSQMEFYVLNPALQVNRAFRRQDFAIKPEGSEGYAISGPPGTAHQSGEFPTLRRLLKKGGTLVKYTGYLPHTQRQQDLVFAKL
jgi:hypothetical protein